MIFADDSLCHSVEVFAQTRSQTQHLRRGPPNEASPTPAVQNPIAPVTAPPAPRVPTIGPLTANILASRDKLFFVSHSIPGSGVREWALVRIDLQLSIKAHPTALQDGVFLAQFYTCHPADKRYNAANQRYWLEYHPRLEVSNPVRKKHTHLIRPSADSEAHAQTEGLEPFSLWLRLINEDTYISGPFNFADINGRRSRDRVPECQWRILAKHPNLSNEVPSLNLPGYSIHYGQFHTSYTEQSVDARIEAYMLSPSTPETV